MKTPESDEVLPAEALALVNSLERSALTVLPDAIARYACAADSGMPGCSKFSECDIHPESLKSKSLADLTQKEYQLLRDERCLRPLIAENEELFRKAVEEGRLRASDFFGAEPQHRDAGSPDINSLIASNRCRYYGCVVPEMLAIFPGAGEVSLSSPPFDKVCPFSRRMVRRDGAVDAVARNPYRLLACDLTREPFREFQRRLGVLSISPVAIVRGSHDDLADIFYIGKDPSASYQYLAMDPEGIEEGVRELREAQPRLHAPRLVRHSYRTDSEGGRSFAEALRTQRSLGIFSKEDTLSALEEELGIRHISAGEFAFLCVMWLWSGEQPGRWYSLAAIRNVVLEAQRDVPVGTAATLLQQLHDMGDYAQDLRRIYGDLRFTGKEYIRESSRLQDLELTGLISREDGEGIMLTERSRALTNWLDVGLAAVVAQAEAINASVSPPRFTKLFPMLSGAFGGARQHDLRAAAALMKEGITTNGATKWLEGMHELFRLFDRTTNRWKYRLFLRDDGFPVYPLVHLTLLLGYSSAVAWIAVPLGGNIASGDEAGRGVMPQAGAFVLALDRDNEGVKKLVNTLRPVLMVPALVETSLLVEEVIRAKATVMDFGAIALARAHEARSTPQRLENYSDSSTRKERLREALGDETKLEELSVHLGRAIMVGHLARADIEYLEEIRSKHWQWTSEEMDVKNQIISAAWSMLKALDEASGRDPSVRGEGEIRAPKPAAIHLVFEGLRNILRHDKSNDPILISVEDRGKGNLGVRLWNSRSKIERRHLKAFNGLHERVRIGSKEVIDGDTALLLLGLMCECQVVKSNEIHPLNGRKVGCLDLEFRRAAERSS